MMIKKNMQINEIALQEMKNAAEPFPPQLGKLRSQATMERSMGVGVVANDEAQAIKMVQEFEAQQAAQMAQNQQQTNAGAANGGD